MKCKKVLSYMLAGTLFLSTAGVGVAFAEDGNSVEFTDELSETPVGGGSSIDESTEVPEENLNTEDDSILVPEETPPECNDSEEPVEKEVPEEPQFSDDVIIEDLEVPNDNSQVTEEEVIKEVTPTVTPTETPEQEEGIKDITFTFGECRYGSTIFLRNSEDSTIATIRTEDGVSTVEEYVGKSIVDGSTVVLEDVEETDFHIITDNDMLGSDVSEFSVICNDGSIVTDKNYENPFWVISERFTLESTATINMSFVNNSFVADEMLDKIDSNPELMEESYPVSSYALDSLDEEPVMSLAATNQKARLEMGAFQHYPWYPKSSSIGTHRYFIRHGKKGEEGYWSARAICMQAHKDGPAEGEYEYIHWKVDETKHPTEDSRRTVILLVLMSPDHVLDSLGQNIWKYSNAEYRFSLCHAAISWICAGTLSPHSSVIGPDGKPTDVDAEILSGIEKKYKKTLNAINKEVCTLATTTYKDTVDKYNLYLYLCGDGTRQNLCFVRKKPAPVTGSISVVKTSQNTSLTSGNANYSLEGAVYGVYSDKSCKTKVGSITTDSSGKGKLGGLKLNTTYYVKEISPSKGYLLDPNVYEAIPK